MLALLAVSLLSCSSTPLDQPVELGRVQWERNFPKGLARAKRTGKPIMLIFQEVPG